MDHLNLVLVHRMKVLDKHLLEIAENKARTEFLNGMEINTTRSTKVNELIQLLVNDLF